MRLLTLFLFLLINPRLLQQHSAFINYKRSVFRPNFTQTQRFGCRSPHHSSWLHLLAQTQKMTRVDLTHQVLFH